MAGEEIIIKKIKKGGHGHHGGAWKVAYADFVTAMMAFFLLMWLLAASSDAQKSGIAEYFTPTIGLKDGKGIGFNGGLSDATKGSKKNDLTQPGIVVGQVKQGEVADTPNMTQNKPNPDASDAAQENPASESQADKETFETAAEEAKQALQETDLKDYSNNVVIQETPEGLKIDMIDDPQKPMFVPGQATLTDMGKKVMDSMARVVAKTPNNVAINGHTDAPTGTANPQYTVWELSADRANAARRFLATTPMEKERVVKVVAHADKELLVPAEPTNPRNRRITILVMRDSYFRDPKETQTTRGLLSVPDGKLKKPEETKPAAPPTDAAPATDAAPHE